MKGVKTISAMKVRKHLGQLLEEVYYHGARYIIERAGRPMAGVVPLQQLGKLREQGATTSMRGHGPEGELPTERTSRKNG